MEQGQNKLTEKRKPKGDIKFELTLNSEQKEAKRTILDTPITVLKGFAGTGKTLLACQIALDMLFKREVDKIVITRPTVSREEIGFLPGDLKEKLDPWLAPIYSNLYLLYNKEKIDKLIYDGVIEVLPFAFMRGRTLVNSFIIADEAQNLTFPFLEMIIGRMGIGSKLVFCGDTSQVDLKNKKDSGLQYVKMIEARVEGFKVITLSKNHRHPIVETVLKAIEDLKE